MIALLEPEGFLGTGTSRLADLTLLAYIPLIVPAMLAVYRLDVAPKVGDQTANPRYLLPARLLATFIVVRMIWEDRQVAHAKHRGETDLQQYWFKAAKWMMRLTLLLWLTTTALGVFSCLTRYNIISLPGADVPTPIATDEVDPRQRLKNRARQER